jgi:hypothetical protein
MIQNSFTIIYIFGAILLTAHQTVFRADMAQTILIMAGKQASLA